MARRGDSLSAESPKAIAKELGLTPFRLSVLTRFTKPNPPRIRGDSSGTYLDDMGYVREVPGSYQREITEAGRELVARARKMGW